MDELRYNSGMQNSPISTAKSSQKERALTPMEMAELLNVKDREIVNLRRQIAWFQRQIFGQKSERRLPLPEGVQGILGEAFTAIPEVTVPGKKTVVTSHVRTAKLKPIDGNDEASLFFDDVDGCRAGRGLRERSRGEHRH